MINLKNYKISYLKLFLFCASVIFFSSCQEREHKTISKKEVVEKPEDISASAEDIIKGTLKDILNNDKSLSDSFKIRNASILQNLYDKNSFEPLWSQKGSFINNGDSLFSFIQQSKQYGLFPEDYNLAKLTNLKEQLSDTSKAKKLDASLWAYADLLLSSAFVQIVKDLKKGRLLPDSVIVKDSTLTPDFFHSELDSFQKNNDSVFEHLEPRDSGYIKLKIALNEFLPKAHFKNHTFVETLDSTQIPSLLYKRLGEEDSTLSALDNPDSIDVSLAIKKYQKRKKINADGKISSSLIDRLNNTDKEKFIRIAINLDRYKLLPQLPQQYIWVNIPSYYLKLYQSDTVVLKSRVVVGKPLTRTPLITSAISNMITYPQWTIPESIVKKEVLPGLQKDATYTMKKGYSIVDDKDNEIDPLKIKWTKYTSSIPYKVVQGSGDENALGVLKFNFPNKYSVYLHDTNQRYLFSNKNRALSHGCVRVQAWEELAKFILRNDSLNATNPVPIDSLESWLTTKQKKYVPIRKPIPLFIRYFTSDVDEKGKLIFYEDIYQEDQKIRKQLFADKTIL